jgi:hypothetical protein
MTFLRLAGARFAADFFAALFLPADFFAVVLLAELFFAEAFFTAPLRVAFFATTFRADFFAGFLAADFFAVFLAAFAMCCVPLNRLLQARILAHCRCVGETTFVLIPRKRYTRTFQATNGVTIELSRALARSMIASLKRSRVAFDLAEAGARSHPAHSRSVPLRPARIPYLAIYSARLRESKVATRAQSIGASAPVSGALNRTRSESQQSSERIKSKRRVSYSQSNFSWPPSSHFCRRDVADAQAFSRNAPRIK